MSELVFRNVAAEPSDPVESWPYEGLVAAIERGFRSDWRRIAAAIRRSPWGTVARRIEEYATYGDELAAIELLLESIRRARSIQENAEHEEVAARVRTAIARSGLSARRFALEIGTSSARLSTYCTGKVQPAASMLVRIETTAQRLSLLGETPEGSSARMTGDLPP